MPGESAGYYNNGNDVDRGYPPPQQPYQQQQYAQYQQNNYNGAGGGGGYTQAPPQYDNQYGPRLDAFHGNEKPTFEQAFKVDKPKLNDWWAGLLLLLVFGGFVAVSGIALQGYGEFPQFPHWWPAREHPVVICANQVCVM
jgi:hypothetical protein